MTIFKTLRSAKKLVYGQLGLYRRMRQARGWGYVRKWFARSECSERILYGIMIAMEDWSRTHRKLSDGRPAVVDAYLRANAGEIRFALDELGAIVHEIEDSARLTAEQWAILDDYKLSLHAAWRLVLDEDEAHQIQRLTRPPVKRQVWQEPEDVPIITDDDIFSLARLLGDTVQAQRTAATTALFAKPVTRFVWN